VSFLQNNTQCCGKRRKIRINLKKTFFYTSEIDGKHIEVEKQNTTGIEQPFWLCNYELKLLGNKKKLFKQKKSEIKQTLYIYNDN